MSKASKIISSAILGLDFRRIVVNGKVYTIKPPTIGVLASASYYLSDIGEGNTISDVLLTITGGAESAARALSCFIKGDDSLYGEFKNAEFDEIIKGLEEALSLINTESFTRLSALTRNVAMLTAKPK